MVWYQLFIVEGCLLERQPTKHVGYFAFARKKKGRIRYCEDAATIIQPTNLSINRYEAFTVNVLLSVKESCCSLCSYNMVGRAVHFQNIEREKNFR